MVEGKELEILAQDSSLLCSCFIILENAIIYVSKHSELDAKSSGTVAFICHNPWCLVRYRNKYVVYFAADATSMELLLKLHVILTEALAAVVQLLRAASQSTILEGIRTKSSGRLSEEYLIVTASVRVLGAWLAEDSLTLTDHVYGVLPFLVELCSTSAPQEEDKDLLKFLLPGLCHMTADDKARPVLISARVQRLLLGYMQQLVCMSEQSR